LYGEKQFGKAPTEGRGGNLQDGIKKTSGLVAAKNGMTALSRREILDN